MPHAALARVVVDEADRARAEVGVELQLADDHLAAGAGADHEHVARLVGGGCAVPGARREPHQEAGAADERSASA